MSKGAKLIKKELDTAVDARLRRLQVRANFVDAVDAASEQGDGSSLSDCHDSLVHFSERLGTAVCDAVANLLRHIQNLFPVRCYPSNLRIINRCEPFLGVLFHGGVILEGDILVAGIEQGSDLSDRDVLWWGIPSVRDVPLRKFGLK